MISEGTTVFIIKGLYAPDLVDLIPREVSNDELGGEAVRLGFDGGEGIPRDIQHLKRGKDNGGRGLANWRPDQRWRWLQFGVFTASREGDNTKQYN